MFGKRPSALSELRNVGIFTALYLAVGGYTSLMHGNTEFLFYIVVVLGLAACIALVHTRVRLSSGVLWLLSLWGLLHLLGGLMPVPETWPIEGDKRVLYSFWLIPGFLKYDHIIHVFGFATTTWVCWQGFQSIDPKHLRRNSILLFSVLAANGLGAFNEIVEFMAVLMIPDTNVGGYINTGWDLVSNLIGTLIAAIVIRFGGVKKKWITS